MNMRSDSAVERKANMDNITNAIKIVDKKNN